MEEFRMISGYSYEYEVSNMGRIRSLKNGRSIFMKNQFDKDGYLIVTLSKGGIQKKYRVHRLVMRSFSGESDLDVNHINGIKDDNRLMNLEYCTRSENIRHSFRILGRTHHMKGKFGSDSKASKKVFQFTKEGEFIIEWGSIIEASNNLSINNGDIGQVCKGKLKTAGGYVWRYNNKIKTC